tara:strand:- start:1500 stop:1883 length:384 start_codon:yes stop_codon:yes gene_type:complete
MPAKKDNYKKLPESEVEMKLLDALQEKDETPKVYQGKTAHHSANCCSKILFCWVNRMIKVANKETKLSHAQYGELDISEKLEASLPALEHEWEQALKSKKAGNVLFRVVFTAFKWDYIRVLFWNFFR